MFEQTKEVIERLYSRRYRVTLAYTDYNVERALDVYKFAVENHLTLYRAIVSYYGYRYRRMENFIRELGLWRTGLGWLMPLVLTKLYFEYMVGNPENLFSIEFFVYHYLPEHLIGYHDIQKAEAFTYDLVSAVPEWDWVTYVGEFKMGTEKKVERWDYVFCCTQRISIDGVFWKYKHERWRIYDRKTFDVELANHVLHHIKLCPEVSDWEILGYA